MCALRIMRLLSPSNRGLLNCTDVSLDFIVINVVEKELIVFVSSCIMWRDQQYAQATAKRIEEATL